MVSEYREREKRSWSEIDKMKDRSSYRREKYEERQKPSSQRALHRYKAQLEKLFKPGTKLGKDAEKKLKKLRETSDRSEFIGLSNKYIEEFGLPHSWGDLENFLRHKEVEILAEVIRRMEVLLGEQTETRKENFQKDLHLIQMTTRNKDLRKQVGQLIHPLGGETTSL